MPTKATAKATAKAAKAAKAEWKIGEIAAWLDTTPKTLRHYEAAGLLAPPMRTAAAYRVYDNAALARATLVLGLRRLGFSIADTADVLSGNPAEPELRHRLAALMERRIQEADEQIGVLQGRREDMAARQRQLFDTAAGASPHGARCLCRLLSMPCGCGRSPAAG